MEEKDLHYLSVLGTRRRQVSQLNVTVEPADDSAEAERDAELVRSYISRDELADELFDLLDAVGKGFSVSEIVWEQSERQWMPVHASCTGCPTWFRYDLETAVAPPAPQTRTGPHLWAELEPGEVRRPRARRQERDRDPGRPRALRSPGRGCSRASASRTGSASPRPTVTPLRIGKYDKGAGDEERAILQARRGEHLKRCVRRHSGIDDDRVRGEHAGDRCPERSLQGSPRNTSTRRSAKAVLGQTLTTEPRKNLRAVDPTRFGQVHNEVREDIEKLRCAKQLAATLTQGSSQTAAGAAQSRAHGRRYPRIRIGREARRPI